MADTPTPPDPTNPAARRPLQPGEATLGAQQLEALNFAKAHAPGDPNGQQILAAQYAYKKYGIMPSGGGGPLGWQIVNGDLVPKDRSWWDKYGMLAVTAGVLSAGTLSAVMGGGAAAAAPSTATVGEGTGVGLEGAGAGLGAVEGLPAGVSDSALASLGTGADAGAFDAAGNFIGPSTVTGASGGGGGILSKAGDILSGGKGVQGYLDTASAIGTALGANEAGRASGRIAQGNQNALYDRTATDLYSAENAANNAKNTYGLNAAGAENNFDLNSTNAENTYGLSRAAGENNFDLSRGNLANANAATDLAQRNFALSAPGKRASNAVRGDILSQAKDVTVSGLAPGRQAVQFNGGLRPSMFSDNTRALGTNMTAQALAEQQAGDHFAPLPDLPDYVAPPAYVKPDYVAPPAYSPGPTAPTLTPMPTAGNTDSILNTAGTVGNITNLLSKLPYGKPRSVRPEDDPNFGA